MTTTAIIGAGPYGLSIAAHLKHLGIPFRIFGRPMDSWVSHMPKGMLLKSDGFASNIYDPEQKCSLKKFCEERGIDYADSGLPVRLDTFSNYGLTFAHRMVPELETKLVVSLDRSNEGFIVRLDDGEEFTARRVILAIGITHFSHVPDNLSHLSPQFLSHSFKHHDMEPFRGRKVVVLGGGSSAVDLAGLLRDSDADVHLVARKPTLQFHTRARADESTSRLHRLLHPKSGIGGGIKLRFYADAPAWFHKLPESTRLKIVRSTLGPSGGWFAKEKVVGRVPLCLGCTPTGAVLDNNQVRLQLRNADGTEHEIVAEHVIAATGYRVDLNRLTFVNPGIRSNVKTVEGTPVLSSAFESSVPGLYVVGAAAANSFGPVLRFAYGAGFAAAKLTETFSKSRSGSWAVSTNVISNRKDSKMPRTFSNEPSSRSRLDPEKNNQSPGKKASVAVPCEKATSMTARSVGSSVPRRIGKKEPQRSSV